jgi:hypothetical protein
MWRDGKFEGRLAAFFQALQERGSTVTLEIADVVDDDDDDDDDDDVLLASDVDDDE